jgi:4-amino-4-deoxy-L-arabinose transferase-like glycosyltransferase
MTGFISHIVENGLLMKLLRSLFTMPVFAVFGLALIVRYFYNSKVARDYFPLHDSLTYQSIAYNILRDHCYCLLPHLQTVDRAPLWPALIALVYGVLGPHDHIVRLLLSIVGSTTCVLIYCFAKDLFGRRVGLCIGLLATIYPFLFIYDGWLYSESVYTFLLLAFCYALYHQQRTPRWSLAVLSGILLGLLSLTRPNGLLILSLCIVWAVALGWRKLLSWRVVVQTTLAVSLISLVLVAPWTIRNFAVTHTLVPVAVGDGKVLLGAYNDMILQRPYYLGIWIIPSESVPAVAQQFPANCADACEVKRDNAYRYYAGQWMLSHLAVMPYLLGLHLVNMWEVTSQEADLAINRFPERDTSHLVVAMMEVLTPIVFALAALGLIVTRKYWRELLLIYLMITLTIVQCIALYGIPRFRAPIEPMLLILAGGAIRWVATIQQGLPRNFADSYPLLKCVSKRPECSTRRSPDLLAQACLLPQLHPSRSI